MAKTLTVTIGRNVGDQPMPHDQWESFRRSVRRTLETAGGEVWADARYRGQWEGIHEDAAIVHALVDDEAVDPVRITLAELAALYGQEAIGLAVGTGELVTARHLVTS